ncbi:MAG: hypothetical protein H7X99_03020 [Saprospiraceae bacterium]|nr:hypothetical protein [Saprospiraceae bacterium]
MKNISLFIVLLLSMGQSFGQNITDVVRWSTFDPVGTARTLGVGSSFGAMGGDFSVININPAGIADYRVSEFTLTPSLRTNKSSAFFDAEASNNNVAKKTNFGLDNIGFVFARNPGSNWTSSNFAIGYSRIADLQRNISLTGNTKGSITTYFAEQANGISPDDLDEFIAYPAYNTGAIFDFDNDNFYETDFQEPDLNVKKNQEISQSGGINELTLGWAGEYKHRMNMGFAIGIPFSSFEELKTYSESDPDDEIALFKSLEYTERLNTSGVGINFKAGFTYKIIPSVRLAGAIHSPSWYRFTDDYSTSMVYSFVDDSPKTFSYDSEEGTFDYRISSPWRALGSLGKTFRAGDIVGFVNVDVEYVDYTNASYNGAAYSVDPEEQAYTNEVNKDIIAKLGSATNVRLGTELGHKNLRLRAGYSWERTAFNADDFFNNKLSFGIGFREDDFFIDLGFRSSKYAEGYNPYVVLDPSLDPLANINSHKTRMAITLGFKF